MITFKQFVSESINDRGIFKAIFVIGLPGAGKSYTVSRLAGQVQPRIVNTDKTTEFLSNKWGKEVKSINWLEFKDTSQRISKKLLTQYINGALPLFVDGTSNNVSNILHRIGILESLGYDVGIIHVNTNIATAIKRAEKRAGEIGRHVDQDFIREVEAETAANVEFLKGKVDFFTRLDNNADGIDNVEIDNLFKKSRGFFSEPLKNPVGVRLRDKMLADKEKYLSPNIISLDALENKIDGWYKT